MSWDGKVVWLTGASSGIGAALAHTLARRDARLYVKRLFPGFFNRRIRTARVTG